MIMEVKDFGYPVRHRRKVPFQPILEVEPDVSSLNAQIFHLETELDRFVLSAKDYSDLITEAFADNIHRSIHLEGNPLSLEEVKRITRNTFREGIKDKERDFPTQEIINHIGIYLVPGRKGRWDSDLVRRVHSFLMAGSDMNRGRFRTDRRSVYSDDGQELFITCPPEHISDELDSMLHWLNRTGSTMYPVIAGALMFHEFESIHPFEDGNGRCGRSLFHLYLQKNGLPNSRLCYIEQEIVSDPERYYDILARTDFFGDYSDIIQHFTTSVLRSYENACQRLRSKDILSRDLDELSRRLILKSKAYKEHFTLREARDWTSESDYVLRKRLSDLVDMGVLWAEGSTKSKRYIFADPIRAVLENPSERMTVLRSTLREDEFK